MKKKQLVIIVPMAIFIIIIAPYFIVPVLNDARTSIITNEVASLPIPERTEILEIVSGFGNTSGTGNHTEIWIGMLLKSELSKDEIQDFFTKTYQFRYPGDRSSIETYSVKEDRHYSLVLSLIGKDLKKLKSDTDHDGYFVVGITENAISSFFDLRGH